ncbi:MAG: transcriptional repressor [Candidatus Hydrogenedentes bacterium]|nr:transcriptional repressor [Candidatus Hydrogenedentota bacterium]
MEARVSGFVLACKERGLRLTHQRLEVYRALAKAKDHPSAEMLYQRVRKRVPTISLDTVYRTLGSLEEEGFIARVGTAMSSARFEFNPEPHHHFVCVRCGGIRDVEAHSLGHDALAKYLPKSYHVLSSHVEFRGLCPDCLEKTSKS